MTKVGEQILQSPARTNQIGHVKGVSMTHVGKSLLMTISMELVQVRDLMPYEYGNVERCHAYT